MLFADRFEAGLLNSASFGTEMTWSSSPCHGEVFRSATRQLMSCMHRLTSSS